MPEKETTQVVYYILRMSKSSEYGNCTCIKCRRRRCFERVKYVNQKLYKVLSDIEMPLKTNKIFLNYYVRSMADPTRESYRKSPKQLP